MSKLYEILDQFKDLSSLEIDSDDDLQAFAKLASEVEGTFEQKVENYIKLIRNFESEAEGFKAEKLRLEKRQRSLENRAEALRKYLEFACKQIMQVGEKRKAGLFSVVLRKNNARLSVSDESLIGDEYRTSEVDNAKLKKALTDGITVSGAELVQDISLRIE